MDTCEYKIEGWCRAVVNGNALQAVEFFSLVQDTVQLVSIFKGSVINCRVVQGSGVQAGYYFSVVHGKLEYCILVQCSIYYLVHSKVKLQYGSGQ